MSARSRRDHPPGWFTRDPSWRRLHEPAPVLDARAVERCSVPSCGRPRHARGWCRAHYRRWWRRWRRLHPLPPVVRPAPPPAAIEAEMRAALAALVKTLAA